MSETLSDSNLGKLSSVELLQAGSDIALLLDKRGKVLDINISDRALSESITDDWRGQSWVDTVSEDSRGKIEELLENARSGESLEWRQVNHPADVDTLDRPIRYCAMKLNGSGMYLAIGRDLQLVADLQQQLISAQETVERDYWRLRQAESRFRLLFQACSDAVLVADAGSERILEVNPLAEQMLREERAGRLSSLFDTDSVGHLRRLLAQATSSGHAEAEGLRLKHSGALVSLSVSLLRQGNAGVFIVILAPENGAIPVTNTLFEQLRELFQRVTDAIVVSDEAGNVLSANPAFVDLAQLATVDQAVGQPLANWLGRSSVDVNVLIANLKKNDRVRQFGTVMRGQHNVSADVEVAATTLTGDDELRGFGFVIRPMDQRIGTGAGAPTSGRSMEQLTELVGTVPLKELVRESADLIEKLSIEAALSLTDNNRAAAAEMLGLSRQSLYVKLRRYGIGESE